jgi:hypothetical protein
MAAKTLRDRRPALWPYLVMPLVVLAVFYALFLVHHRPGSAVDAVAPGVEDTHSAQQ